MFSNISAFSVGVLVCEHIYPRCYQWLTRNLQAVVTGVAAIGPAAVKLGSAANYAILAKSGVSTVAPSSISMFAIQKLGVRY